MSLKKLYENNLLNLNLFIYYYYYYYFYIFFLNFLRTKLNIKKLVCRNENI